MVIGNWFLGEKSENSPERGRHFHVRAGISEHSLRSRMILSLQGYGRLPVPTSVRLFLLKRMFLAIKNGVFTLAMHVVREDKLKMVSGFIYVFLLAAISCGNSSTSPKLDPGSRTPIPALTDEFNGTALDSQKWWPNNPHWAGREPSYFHTNNVEVKDGMLHIHQRKEHLPDMPPQYSYTTGAVKSKTLIKYGYFEIRCKTMPAYASSAFWFYHSTAKYWTEIDVFEIFGTKDPVTVYMNAHVFPPSSESHWSRGGQWASPDTLYRDFHTYALDWRDDFLIYYYDGTEIRKMANSDWHDLLTLNIDSETMPEWIGFDDSYLPATYYIDYVRAWKYNISETGSL